VFVKWLVLFMGFIILSFLFMFLSFLSQVTRHVFVTFLWCCVERGDLLSFLVLIFLVIE
jgi:hypothetical protein